MDVAFATLSTHGASSLSTDRFEVPDEEMQARSLKFLDALNEFRTVDPKIPSSYIATFMAVALKPGFGPTEYAKMLGTIQPIASRWLLEIGIKARERAEPLGLVDRDNDPTNLRQQRYFLTAKGKALFNRLQRRLGE